MSQSLYNAVQTSLFLMPETHFRAFKTSKEGDHSGKMSLIRVLQD